MKITKRKILSLIRESLTRSLNESEDRIADLKDQFNLVYQKMSRAKTQKEFDQLSAEADRLDQEINRLTKTLYKEPEEPGEWDEFTSDPIQPPMLSRGTEVGAFQDDIDPLDQPAMLDVSGGDGNDFTGGPMTKRDMDRREFMQNLGVGIGASALLGKQIFDATTIYEDPHSITAAKFAQLNDDEVTRYVNAYVDMEFEHTFAGALESVHAGAVESISDEITDNMIHQILEDENAGINPMYEKLYDTLIGKVENSVMRYEGMQ